MVYADRALCDQVTCFAEMNGIWTFFDDRHLSASRSRTMSRFFSPPIEKLVSSR